MASDSVTKPKRTIKKKDEREYMLKALDSARWELRELAESNRRAIAKLQSNANTADQEADNILNLLIAINGDVGDE